MATPIELLVHLTNDSDQERNWFTGNLLALLTFGSTLIAGWFALRKWRADEKWKRTAAAFDRIKSFSETPGTRNAMMILKSRARPIPLLDANNPPSDGTGIYRQVTWIEARDALVPSCWNIDQSPHGNAIRDSFEDFIDRMTQIEMYLSANLISENDARPLVAPWAHRLQQDWDDGLAQALRVYVECEHSEAFQRLFARFGANLRTNIVVDMNAVCGRLEVPLTEQKSACGSAAA